MSEHKETIDRAENLTCITRATVLQEAMVSTLDTLLENIEALKAIAIDNKNEDEANAFLSIGCALNALQSHIKVSIHLKQDLPDEAWNHLIFAQDYAASAIVAHPINAHLEHQYCVYLGALERLVFPPQVFMSTGLTVDEEECSICNGIYGECGHVAGKAYMGKFCCIEVKKIRKFNEVSIVDDPADKRCRVTHYHIGGKRINRMTLEEESE